MQNTYNNNNTGNNISLSRFLSILMASQGLCYSPSSTVRPLTADESSCIRYGLLRSTQCT